MHYNIKRFGAKTWIQLYKIAIPIENFELCSGHYRPN
mgnify:FL=1